MIKLTKAFFSLLIGLVIGAIALAPVAASAQNQAQNMDHGFTQQQIDNMVWTAVKTELKAALNDHSVFIYHDHDMQPQKDKYTVVIQTVLDGSIDRVTRVNGKAIPIQAQSAKVYNYVNTPALQQKRRENSQNDAKQAAQLLQMIPSAFVWSVKEITPEEITLSYMPNPNFNPPTMEDRVFAAMAGEMVLNREQHRIVVFKGRLIHNVNFFFGLIGHMNQGGTFCVVRKELEPKLWEIVETRVHINGHILFFKTISQNEDDYNYDLIPAPANLSLNEAAKVLMQQPDWPNTPGSKNLSDEAAPGACGAY